MRAGESADPLDSKLLGKVRAIRCLESAWAAIRSNGRRSQSTLTRSEIKEFEKVAGVGLRRIQRELRSRKFSFPAAFGVAIDRGIGKERRPIVKSPIPSRIVQRAIHDVLLELPQIRDYAENPFSYGGVRRRDVDGRSAVPAAVSAAIEAIKAGATYFIRSDIRNFFRAVPRLQALDVIYQIVKDEDFMRLMSAATTVELENIAKLRERRFEGLFPTYELGVAQGNNLSPLLGNILLSEFDVLMNSGCCTCIRYIDDFLILGPNRTEVRKAFFGGLANLKKLGLDAYPPGHDKAQAGDIAGGFDFLGVNLHNGSIKPSKSSKARFLRNIDEHIRVTIKNSRILGREGWRYDHALTNTLKTLDNLIRGWGDQYSFCNERNIFKALDTEIDKRLKSLFGAYGEVRKAIREPLLRRRLLGIRALIDCKYEPLSWAMPKPQPSKLSDASRETHPTAHAPITPSPQTHRFSLPPALMHTPPGGTGYDVGA